MLAAVLCRCILLEGSVVEGQSVLAPGSLLPPGRLVPRGQLWAGNPARFVRDLTKDEVTLLASETYLEMLCNRKLGVL